MAREVSKSRKRYCIFEDGFGKTKQILEFQYQEEPQKLPIWDPCTDIYETAEDIIIVVEAAGLDETLIQLQAEENRLNLSGQRKHEEAQTIVGYHQVEIQFMSFQKTFVFPGSVDPDQVSADYRNGLLTIRIHKDSLKR